MVTESVLMEFYSCMSDEHTYHLLLEICMLAWLIWLLWKQKTVKPKENIKLSHEEIEELILEWTPEPLVSDTPENHRALHPRVVTGKVGKYLEVDGKRCLNMATHNFLGLVENAEVELAALTSLKKYGVGSCGPRGFYGTVDVHLELEDRLAKFMSTEAAVVYSYGFSTIASAIPAYAKRMDVIFVDEKVNFSIQKGLEASRSKILFFKHNDMEDLERLLKEQKDFFVQFPKKARRTRQFLVVEGVYMNTGQIAPLPQLIALRKKYKMRMFMDESISFGTLGKTGRGLTEYFKVPIEDVDLISGSLEWSIGAVGGFCVGSNFIVEHQRLSGLGYCFSASVPPLLAAASISALDLMERDPQLFSELSERCSWLHDALASLDKLVLGGHRDSPIKHLYLRHETGSRVEDLALLDRVVNHCGDNGVAVTSCAYLEVEEKNLCAPSLRITTNCLLTEQEVKKTAFALREACEALL